MKRKDPALQASDAPLVLYEKAASALRLAALDRRAVTLGLYLGQPLAEARAIEPALIALSADPARAAKDFRALGLWLTRYAPFVGVPEPGEAFLDVTGAAHLFGGEAALLDDALMRLARAGFSAQGAIAGTPGMAFAAAHFSRRRIITSGDEKRALADLPVSALRLRPETVRTLRRLGLKRIGQLYDLPRAPARARMGKELIARLRAALGEEDEPINPIFPQPDYEVSAPLIEPIVSAEAIMIALQKLAGDLEAGLLRDGKGGRRFELCLYRVDGHAARIAIGVSRPTRQPPALLRLFKDRLTDLHDEREAGFGYDLLKLRAFDVAPYEASAPATFDAPEASGDLAALADRLINRMGARVRALDLKNAHMPERSAGLAGVSSSQTPLLSPSPQESFPRREAPDAQSPRPTLLLPAPEEIAAMALAPDGPPLRFIWRRIPYAVKKASGPERLAGDWRREKEEPTRDYYRVEDEKGRRFWIYREGFYGKERPKWFLHGFFG